MVERCTVSLCECERSQPARCGCAAGILERYPAQAARTRQGGFWDSATDLLPKYLMLVRATHLVHLARKPAPNLGKEGGTC